MSIASAEGAPEPPEPAEHAISIALRGLLVVFCTYGSRKGASVQPVWARKLQAAANHTEEGAGGGRKHVINTLDRAGNVSDRGLVAVAKPLWRPSRA